MANQNMTMSKVLDECNLGCQIWHGFYSSMHDMGIQPVILIVNDIMEEAPIWEIEDGKLPLYSHCPPQVYSSHSKSWD